MTRPRDERGQYRPIWPVIEHQARQIETLHVHVLRIYGILGASCVLSAASSAGLAVFLLVVCR